MPLPRFIVLQSNSNNKYLRYRHEDDDTHMFLQFSEDRIGSEYVKFEVEVSQTQEPVVGSQTQEQLVHLKCCYNSKYWGSLQQESESGDRNWVAANADNKEEDKTERSCTLFRPIYVDENQNTIRFWHVNLERYVCLQSSGTPYDSCLLLYSENTNNDQRDVFNLIDWESLFIMPQFVAFKGHNGKYVSGCKMDNHNYLQFSSADKDDPQVVNEIFSNSDGKIRIKSIYFDRFWKRSTKKKIWGIFPCRTSHWIFADYNEANNENMDVLFQPRRIKEKTVALENFGNKKFCQKLIKGKRDCLSADGTFTSVSSHLVVEDLAFERSFYNVRYHLKEARISDKGPPIFHTTHAVNNEDRECSIEVKIQKKCVTSRTWKISGSLKLGLRASVEIGTLPKLIMGGKIDTYGEILAGIEFGNVKTEEKLMEATYKIPVPGRRKVIVNATARELRIDVPFSYFQRDSYIRRDPNIQEKHDGMYTGVDYSDFEFTYVIETLPN